MCYLYTHTHKYIYRSAMCVCVCIVYVDINMLNMSVVDFNKPCFNMPQIKNTK